MPTWCAGILGTRPPFLPLLITSQAAGLGECGYRTFSAMETRAVSSTVRTPDGGSVQGVDLGTGTDLPELSAQVSIRYSTFVNEAHVLLTYVCTNMLHACTHTSTYACTHTHVHIQGERHACTHIYIHICMHSHTCTHTGRETCTHMHSTCIHYISISPHVDVYLNSSMTIRHDHTRSPCSSVCISQ